MIYVEAPDTYQGTAPSLFMAGGITGCPDWQQELVGLLRSHNLALFNPRRQNFPIDDPRAAEEQITWEFDHLRRATAISFWFCAESLCPIVLYELGAWTRSDKPIFIGVHPKYPRRNDVIIQTRLARPDLQIVSSIYSLAISISDWALA